MRSRPALALLLLLGACAGAQRVETAPVAPAAPPAKPRSAAEQARDLFAEGVEEGREARHEAAAEAFETAYRLDPSLAWAGTNAGIFFERAGDLGRARAAYEAVLARTPDLAEASLALTRLRIRSGKAVEAEEALRALLQRQPESLALRNQLVEALAAQGKLDEAEREARAILRGAEQDAHAMVSLAGVYYQRKRYELARMVLENARQVHPQDPTIWNKLAFVDLAQGDRPQAMERLRRAASLREDYPEAHVNYGALLVEAEDYAGAVKELELAVKHAPASAEAWLGLGNAYRGEKRFDDAKRAYDRALLLDPAGIDAQFNLGLLHLDVEKPGMATAERLEKAIAALDRYAAAGGTDAQTAGYRKAAAALLDREKKRLAREERERLRTEAEARRKAEAAAAAAAQEEAPRRVEEEARRAEAARAQVSTPTASPASTSTAPPAATPTAPPAPAAAPTPPPTASPTPTPRMEEAGGVAPLPAKEPK